MLKALSWYYVCSRIMRAGACMPAKKVREEEDRFKACWSLISSICIDHAFLVCIKKHTAQYKMDLQVSITNNTCAIEVNSSSGRNISLCRAGINHTPHGNTQHDCSHMSTYWPHQSLVPSSRSSLQHPRRLRNANRMSDGRRSTDKSLQAVSTTLRSRRAARTEQVSHKCGAVKAVRWTIGPPSLRGALHVEPVWGKHSGREGCWSGGRKRYLKEHIQRAASPFCRERIERKKKGARHKTNACSFVFFFSPRWDNLMSTYQIAVLSRHLWCQEDEPCPDLSYWTKMCTRAGNRRRIYRPKCDWNE